ncbi:adenine-specific DNA methylase [Thermohalobacter berrensis]|uniref:site-specific DNA-methyltransferase (adenine-specific) n=2 Tax=Thermohalobacter berrensis TaxID=99594 RepID=A0A419T5P1_9FIRM|nr:adenine-specific DNA methylase [Thermohalobacter berrensis]
MISMAIKDQDIIENPYLKVIDPACGGGYFLEEIYNRLKEILEKNYNKIVQSNPDIKKELEKGIHRFIIKNNLWGADIDEFAVYMTTVTLLLKGKNNRKLNPNIFKKDILLEGKTNLLNLYSKNDIDSLNDISFDLVIGNPPYIGHKKINKDYRKKIKDYYYDVFSDKSDLSYCFIRRGYELLRDDGRLVYITSRYFQEAPSAKGLRNFMKKHMYLDTIIDFYGEKVFKNAGISPVIIKCYKRELDNNRIHIYKLKDDVKLKLYKNKKALNINDKNRFNRFTINQNSLNINGWILIDEKEKNLYDKIHSQGNYFLSEVCNCNQGIITGCDKAFIVDKDTIKKEDLEKDIIRPWIKNSNIRKYIKDNTTQYLLYTDLIDDITKYPNILKHIMPYKIRLEKRRECRKGIRKWYHLQWGRKLDIFQSPKIIFPFKANKSRFTLDYDGVFCSADVYILTNNNSAQLSLEYLLGFLNSSLFEFYFKSVAKKVSSKMYDYYPNKIMNLKIKVGDNKHLIEDSVKEMIHYLKIKKGNNKEIENLVKSKQEIINRYFYKLYGLNDEEINIINNKVN